MANAIYPAYKQALLDGLTNTDLNDGDVRAILVDLADYTYNAAHDFLDDVPAGARVGVSTALQNTTVTNGLFDADNITIAGVAGDVSEAIILYIHTGNEATARLVAFLDTGITGIPVTPNGGDIALNWNASGIFQL
jgi:hypothetical protein